MRREHSFTVTPGVVQAPEVAKFSVSATALRALIGWVLILASAIINGAFREGVLIPKLGTTAGLMLSGMLLAACVVLVAVVLMARLGHVSPRRCLGIGAFWLVLTLGFEFGFGRAIQHKAWAELLDAYTFSDGNLWSLVLLVVAFAPLWAARFRQRRQV